MRTLRLTAASILLLSSSLSAQDWQAAAGGDGGVLRVENADGFGLQVGPASGRQASCRFRLPEGSTDQLDSEKLPTLTVLGLDPQRVIYWPDPAEPPEDGGDFMEVARRSVRGAPLVRASATEIQFACWIGLRNQSSPTRGVLRQLMDGQQLVVSYFIVDGSPSKAVFELDGAGEAIAGTLGMTEQPTEKDYLQDELLRTRVHHRSATCYLLAGKKNRKRCLEAVNRCAGESHGSVVDLVTCIEIEQPKGKGG